MIFMKNKNSRIYDVIFVGVLAAMVYVVTLFRFQLLGSKVHFANAVCLLGGMLLGPVLGGCAAGLGSALYDMFAGYDFINVLITFVSKFAMAWVCGKIMAWKGVRTHRVDRTTIAAAICMPSSSRMLFAFSTLSAQLPSRMGASIVANNSIAAYRPMDVADRSKSFPMLQRLA